ncbi:MAG: hypothetical protein VX642_00940 [Bdellovibrionota bacterium]|nr:hypothetical protein [Bdellovibrionota bacterium]
MSSHLRKFYAPLFTALILAIGSNAIATTGSRMCSQSATNESMSQELSQNFETLKTSESRLSIEEVETFSEELSTEISSLETDIETQTNNLTNK